MTNEKDTTSQDNGVIKTEPSFIEQYQDLLIMLALLVGCLYLFMWGTWSYSFWDPWEPKYAQALREMGARGDYITPYFDGRIRWTKPILIYWLMAIPVILFGNNEFTVRLPSVITATLGVIFVYWFLRKLRSRTTALMGACILCTIPQYFYLARQAMPDMLLCVFTCAAMGFLALGRFGKEKQTLYFLLFYISIGLAFLSKGPVACAIVFGAVLLFWCIDFTPKRLLSVKMIFNDIKSMLFRYRVWIGLIFFIVVAGPWTAYMLAKYGFTYIEKFLFWENIDRFTHPIRGHHGTISFYLKTIFHSMYPWTCLLPAGVFFLFNTRKPVNEDIRQKWYFVCWFLSPFLIFSLAGTKIHHYILPATPAIAVMVALIWEQYFDKKSPYWIRAVFIVSVIFLLIVIRDFWVEGDKYILINFNNKRDIGGINIEMALQVIFAGWVIACGLVVLLKRSRIAAAVAILTAFTNGVYFCHYVIPQQDPYRSMAPYVAIFDKQREPNSELVFFGKKLRASINYYHRNKTFKRFKTWQDDALVEYLGNKSAVFIIVRKSKTKKLIRRLSESQGCEWWLVDYSHPKYNLITNLSEDIE